VNTTSRIAPGGAGLPEPAALYVHASMLIKNKFEEALDIVSTYLIMTMPWAPEASGEDHVNE
jgi:hypothetical protein